MGEVSEPIKKCAALLKNARDDTEKFAALFLVTKLVRAKDCQLNAKRVLFDAIGFDFLKRLLLTTDVPVDCPPSIYKSVALSVLTTFCNEPDLATDAQMLSNATLFIDIVRGTGVDDEEDLIVMGEAYKCLKCIASHEAGRRALHDAGALAAMNDIYARQTLQCDDALDVLVLLAQQYGGELLDAKDPRPFHALLNRIALDFETDRDERKFELCTTLNALLHNASDRGLLARTGAAEPWVAHIYKSLSDILKSKIGKQQRNPALILCATMTEIFGVNFVLNALTADADAEIDDDQKKFFLLVVQLAAIEVRMQLDGVKSVAQALKEAALTTACYSILEQSLAYIARDQLDIDQREKQSLYTAMKGAFAAVLNLLAKVDADKNRDKLPPLERVFVAATVRVLAAWLAQETSAMRPQVNAILPYVLHVATESFRAYSEAELARRNASGGGDAAAAAAIDYDLLRLLLPSLCHLAVDDDARKLMLKSRVEATLFDCVRYHWSIVHYKRPPVPRSERLKYLNQPQEVPRDVLDKQEDSRAAIVSACNIFMNLTVLEGKVVEESATFDELMRFIFDNLPELKDVPENLLVGGNLAVLGLLLLKQQSRRVKKNDFSICRYIQSTIRFLWDAYVVDESSTDPNSSLVVAMTYKEHWVDGLMELWFLGMQTMAAVLAAVPWISEFAIESGWADGIVVLLKKVKVGALQPNVKMAFEDFLCRLVDANPEAVAEVLKKADALKACRNHRLMELGKKLFGD